LSVSHAIPVFCGRSGPSHERRGRRGSFVAFPALLFTGMAPVPANATRTLSLWVGTTASGGAYRKRLKIPWRVLIPLVINASFCFRPAADGAHFGGNFP